MNKFAQIYLEAMEKKAANWRDVIKQLMRQGMTYSEAAAESGRRGAMVRAKNMAQAAAEKARSAQAPAPSILFDAAKDPQWNHVHSWVDSSDLI